MINYYHIENKVKIVKKLVRIKLINWHLFANQTIEIRGNSLLSGENGAGKSTFLDAIQYVLTGGKAKFNNAANSQAKRDLEGYVRCKLGIENKTYLRNNEVTTHIALEFRDEMTNVSQIIGVVIEINKSGRIYEHFYVLKNKSISDDLFVENKIILGYSAFKKTLIKNNIEYLFCETKEQARKCFLDVLNINNYKYIELIPKALAFRPIDELHKFVFDFLLNQKDISITELKQNVHSYREFENLLETLKEKEELLEKIANNYKLYNDYINKEDLLKQLKKYSDHQELILREKKLEEKITQTKILIEELNTKKKELDKEYENRQIEIDRLNSFLNKQDIGSIYQELEKKLREKEKQYHKKLTTVNDFKLIIQHEENLMQYVYQNLQKDDNLLLELNNYPLLTKIKQLYERIKEQLVIEINDLKKQKQLLNERIKNVCDEINSLERNNHHFNESITKLKNLITKEIEKVTGRKEAVYALCELLEVSDESWRNALEGYLNTQRFDLIIDVKYFDIALLTYHKYQKQESISGVGLVNTKELGKYELIKENSLATKVRALNKNARSYANMLLNPVVCCENVADLKKFPIAITKSGMLYKNYTARQINHHIYEKPYIGINALKLQLEAKIKERVQLDKEKQRMMKEISEKEFYLEKLRASQLDYINQNLHILKEFNDLKEEINGLKEKYQNYKENQEVKKITQELLMLKESLKISEEEKNTCLIKIGKLSSDLEKYQVEYDSIKETILNINEEYDELVLEYYEDLFKQKLTINNVKEFCEKELKENDKNIKDLKMQLVSQMNNYNIKYQMGFGTNLEDIDNYIKELTRIREYELVKYQKQAQEAREKCELAFKEQFIYQLRENIIDAKKELDYLNQALASKKFGNDEYEFIYQASHNLEYRKYYELIMSDGIIDLPLFAENISEQNKLVLKDLYDKLVIDSNDSKAQELLQELCDYRNYMSYDIKIKHYNGEITYFSKVSREKSGGETQTPFYVVIAASFEQLITDKLQKSPACFVMFDEAFNNMDESRINAMMNFYQQLDIQLLIAVPPQRIETIIPYVNTTLIVMKDENKSYIESFSYQNKESTM